METPYGSPSGPIAVGEIGGWGVAFLPRHGVKHQHPPHRVPYRANVWAMKELGVQRIVGPCAAGSLQPQVKPGQFVVCDQLVDRTWGREGTFYDGGVAHHVSFADPYCPELRQVVVAAGRAGEVAVRDGGTIVVVQGPRFSTRAESAWFRGQGWEVINMTQHPEAVLARELGLCYATIALITDYDTGLEGTAGVEPVSQEAVFRFFEENLHRVRDLLFDALPRVPATPGCDCAAAAGPDLPR